MTIPTYTDAHIERHFETYLEKGYSSQQAGRWAAEQAYLDWMEQVNLLSDTVAEKMRLVDLATQKMTDEGQLNNKNLKRHTNLVQKLKQGSEEENYEMSNCLRWTHIGLLAANIALRAITIYIIMSK